MERWLHRLLSTPGLTAIRDPADARRVHFEESLAALDVVRGCDGPIVDVGSGGGAPGIPLAWALSERRVTLLEANARKCEFLELVARDFPNVAVVRGRAEEQPVERFGVAVAKALAAPSVAAEWCLPLVWTGGAAVLFVGASADHARAGAVAAKVGGELIVSPPGLLVLRKIGPTPAGFPRRPGTARKRPLA